MKHIPVTTANALGITTALVFVACRLLVGIFPDVMFAIAQSWLHGISLAKFDTSELTLISFLVGLLTASATAWVLGYVFATLYNYFLKTK